MDAVPIVSAAARRLLLFDGECGICNWLAGRARRLDRRGAFSIVPYQDLPDEELALRGVNRARCAESLHLIEELPDPVVPRRRIHRGAFAVNSFLWRIPPWPLAVALLYLLPPLLLLEILGYRLVARHRAAISRRLGLEGCRVERQTGG